MAVEIIVLIGAALLGSFLGWRLVQPDGRAFRLSLVFSGAYLFSLTIIHVIPELFTETENPSRVGLFVLLGFFLQVALEYFTGGVEHGHLHSHHGHNHGSPHGLFLMVALCLHAFMDGTLLSGNAFQHAHLHQHGNVLLIGLALHKIPAALALVTVLRARHLRPSWLLAVILLFTLASPVGLVLSNQMATGSLLPPETFVLVFAVVSGTFLHISTTIFFESTPDHQFQMNRLLVSLLGAGLAVITEILI